MENQKSNKSVKFDGRLALSLDFVCKSLEVKRQDFATLALANLLDEELNWIEHNAVNVQAEEAKRYRKTVNAVKVEANGWVLNIK